MFCLGFLKVALEPVELDRIARISALVMPKRSSNTAFRFGSRYESWLCAMSLLISALLDVHEGEDVGERDPATGLAAAAPGRCCAGICRAGQGLSAAAR